MTQKKVARGSSLPKMRRLERPWGKHNAYVTLSGVGCATTWVNLEQAGVILPGFRRCNWSTSTASSTGLVTPP